jgi:sugar lactone lactonase YvrE
MISRALCAGLCVSAAASPSGPPLFSYPEAVAADPAGIVYVSDTFNDTIRKIARDGEVTTLAGLAGCPGSADGTGGAARFHHPLGLALDAAGCLYVADWCNNTIRKVTPTGIVTTLAGSPGHRGTADGAGSAARFFYPQGIALDRESNIYVADSGNDAIRKVTPSGVVTTFAGTCGGGGLADGAGDAAEFYNPRALAIDGKGNLYVADRGNGAVRKITPRGIVTTLTRRDGGRFAGISGVTVDRAGNVCVADTDNNAIRQLTPEGAVAALAGSIGESGRADGKGTAARFQTPQGLAMDAEGNVYVADALNSTIRKVTPAGAVTTLAGVARHPGSSDGPARGNILSVATRRNLIMVSP